MTFRKKGKSRSTVKVIGIVLVLMLVTGVVGGAAFAGQGDGFKEADCPAIGDALENLPANLQGEAEEAFARFREKLEQLRADFHAREAPRRDYREDFHADREDAREHLMNELPAELEESLQDWRANNARENDHGGGGMKRNQQFEGNKGGGGQQHRQ